MPNNTAKPGKSFSDAAGGIFHDEEVRCAKLGEATITVAAPITATNQTRMTIPDGFP
ncbi:hypothetical protein [Brevundimonas sp. G8]|uniref:hypothetical protein n=1 Tax=Brevundimonas sp. G8 TaxID=1350776 RepID=UPI0012F3D680|nr:hypothetical protein [Brevundimonas sp. G8]VXB01479.1 hypothetical protein BREVUG8_100153 [Brevundimonas sp. G8]